MEERFLKVFSANLAEKPLLHSDNRQLFQALVWILSHRKKLERYLNNWQNETLLFTTAQYHMIC